MHICQTFYSNGFVVIEFKMDRKNLPPPNNGDGLQHGQIISQPNKAINIKTESKQMTSASSNEPKRVIKQIVSLDSKKLKALGIESNILSALTKFNGKEKSFTQKKPSIAVDPVHPSTSSLPTERTTETNVQPQPTISTAAISPVKPIVALHGASAQCDTPETPATKKIHVLSNVLLNENILDLKDFTAIASSTPVSTNITYVPQVPKPRQIQPDEKNQVRLSECSEISATVDASIEPTDEKRSPANSHEIDALKGFSTADLKYSQNQYEHFRNEIQPKPSQIQSVSNEFAVAEAKSQIKHQVELDTTSSSQTMNENQLQNTLSSTNTTSKTVTSSESSSGSESDLDELIKEAQMTIENELTNDTGSTEEILASPKKPRLVQKELLDLLADHVDKDRLIDDFLDSTINSFRTRCDSPMDSDSSIENFESVDIGMQSNSDEECETFEKDKTHEENISKAAEKCCHDVDESTTRQLDHFEKPKIPQKSKKRKSIVTSETNSKQRKLQFTIKTDAESGETFEQTEELPTNDLGDNMDEQAQRPPDQCPQIIEGNPRFD